MPKGLVLEAREKRRFKHYFYGTTFLAAVMCSLRNRPRSGLERQLFAKLSALAFVFDDLADASNVQGDVKQSSPEAFGRDADQRGLALHLLQNIEQNLPARHLEQFRGFMRRVFEVETNGRQRLAECPDLEMLEQVTAEKGGCSVLLFRRLLEQELSAAETAACFRFGSLLQCSDDIFDLWHDRQAGIATLATCLTERSETSRLQAIFEHQVKATENAFRQTTFPAWQVETALWVVHFLTIITEVCLERYSALEARHGKLPLDDRTAIVVDMKKNANRIRVLRHLTRRFS